MQQKNQFVLQGNSYKCILGAGEKKNGLDNHLLSKAALEWLTDQKNILLYRDGEENPSSHFMVDILQQKGESENKTKPQINLQATG